MSSALVLVRLALAAVFAVAGLAKLLDRAGARRALAGFGVPAPLAAPLGVLLPLAEIAVAALLLPAPTALAGALGAVALLGAFAAAIALQMRRGLAPDCHCFGALHSRPVGRAALVRVVVIGAVAAAVAGAGMRGSAGPGALAWLLASPLATPTGGLVALGLAGFGATGAVLVGLLRQNGRLMLRVEALEAARPTAEAPPPRPAVRLVGAPVPDVRLPMLDGPTLAPADLAGTDAVLVFWNPRCGYCQRMRADLQALDAALASDPHAARLVIVAAGAPDALRAEGFRAPVLVDDAFVLGRAVGASGTPSAVRLDASGRLASPVAVGAEGVLALVRAASAVPA